MKFEDYKEWLATLEKEENARPWYIKYPAKVGEYIWYRIICNIADWPMNVKHYWQKITKGYCDSDIWNLSYFMVRKIRAPFKEFVRYQEEHGHSLPLDFQTDPAGWLVALSKMEYAIDHTWMEDNDPEYDFTIGLNNEQMTEHYKKIDEGFQLLGKFFTNLWD